MIVSPFRITSENAAALVVRRDPAAFNARPENATTVGFSDSKDLSTSRDRLGRPLRDLRVSVTDRCNFRCDYCMPAAQFADERRFLPNAELLRFDEIERVVRVACELGVRKLRLTGGEPLLRPNLDELIARLARLPGLDEITLTTNGFLLAEKAQRLRDAGLTRLTLSLDSLDPQEFTRMSGGVPGLPRLLHAIAAVSDAGFAALKLNCVVIKGQNEAAILALAERFRGTPHIVRFIEYMDVGTQNQWRAQDVVSATEILGRIESRWPLQPLTPNYPGEVARRYRYRDGSGEIGVIASVSAPFCGQCQRARLSADGRLLTCLFAEQGVELKPLLRRGGSDAELRALVNDTWSARTDRYSEQRAALTKPGSKRRRLEMYEIGG
jgi:cyclic pyranopterin phosphate synthase